MAKDSDEAADRPWNGDKAGWIEAEKLLVFPLAQHVL